MDEDGQFLERLAFAAVAVGAAAEVDWWLKARLTAVVRLRDILQRLEESEHKSRGRDGEEQPTSAFNHHSLIHSATTCTHSLAPIVLHSPSRQTTILSRPFPVVLPSSPLDLVSTLSLLPTALSTYSSSCSTAASLRTTTRRRF